MGTYAGAFEDGIRNGEGTMTFNDGITYTGKWDKKRPGEYPEHPRITYPSSDADDTQGDSPIQEPTNRRLAEVPAAHPHAKTTYDSKQYGSRQASSYPIIRSPAP